MAEHDMDGVDLSVASLLKRLAWVEAKRISEWNAALKRVKVAEAAEAEVSELRAALARVEAERDAAKARCRQLEDAIRTPQEPER